MGIVEAIFLGVVQGLTEFIPVSSSGHEVLVEHFFGAGHDHIFLDFINIGTVLALIIYFWPKIMDLLEETIFRHNWRLARNIFISAVPAGVIGLALGNVIDSSPFFTDPWVVAVMMLAVGVVMIYLEKLPRLSKTPDGEHLSQQRAWLIGAAQAVALVPGTSRSGSTIVAGRLMGMNPEAAAEYSFLLSVPIMLGVVAQLFVKGANRAYLAHHLAAVVVSNVAAFGVGLLAIGLLMRYLARHNLSVFGWYRVVLAVAVMGLLLIK